MKVTKPVKILQSNTQASESFSVSKSNSESKYIEASYSGSDLLESESKDQNIIEEEEPLKRSRRPKMPSTTNNRSSKLKIKSKYQTEVLMKELAKGEKWSKKKVTNLACKLNLSFSQVYKWKWDYLKRQRLKKEKNLKKLKKE